MGSHLASGALSQKKVQSQTPRWQTLVADTRASIAAWTGALDVRRVAPERSGARANEFPLEPGAPQTRTLVTAP